MLVDDVEKGKELATIDITQELLLLLPTNSKVNVMTQSNQNPLLWLPSTEICKLSSVSLGVASFGGLVAGYGFLSMNYWLISFGLAVTSGAVFAGVCTLGYGVYNCWTATTHEEVNEQAKSLVFEEHHNHSCNTI